MNLSAKSIYSQFSKNSKKTRSKTKKLKKSLAKVLWLFLKVFIIF